MSLLARLKTLFEFNSLEPRPVYDCSIEFEQVVLAMGSVSDAVFYVWGDPGA